MHVANEYVLCLGYLQGHAKGGLAMWIYVLNGGRVRAHQIAGRVGKIIANLCGDYLPVGIVANRASYHWRTGVPGNPHIDHIQVRGGYYRIGQARLWDGRRGVSAAASA